MVLLKRNLYFPFVEKKSCWKYSEFVGSSFEKGYFGQDGVFGQKRKYIVVEIVGIL